MRKNFTRPAILLLALIFLSLACLSSSAKPTDAPLVPPDADKPTKASAKPVNSPVPPTEKPAATPEPAATVEQKPAVDVALGDEVRVENGGFSVRQIIGFEITLEPDAIVMLKQGGNLDSGPMIGINGTSTDTDYTAQESFELVTKNIDSGMTLSNKSETTINDKPAYSADVSGTASGKKPVNGRILIIQVTPRHMLLVLGAAPPDQWESDLQPYFEPVLASLKFFDIAPPASDGTLKQWAVSAKASSQFGDIGWSASKATGEPNVTVCEDNMDAWASKNYAKTEWIELTYEQAVQPYQIDIHETYGPDYVSKIELKDTQGKLHTVYTGKPKKQSECPYILSQLIEAEYKSKIVRITLNYSGASTWNEIDAVELTGKP